MPDADWLSVEGKGVRTSGEFCWAGRDLDSNLLLVVRDGEGMLKGSVFCGGKRLWMCVL